ncbi:serine hydrolase [Rhodococcus sp. IEGM 1408]|uniref:serine hydrolase n=1 Tax=Rhodococcus sp. IEGM 1408 TaxID=3082220 RepID=UPI002954E0BC|nr:serine hydrolase [Rhodococcus sp. IEGM 1408]MDV8002182.1 serine hydrolase [Rhodococcus sp. IEGM 1408]
MRTVPRHRSDAPARHLREDPAPARRPTLRRLLVALVAIGAVCLAALLGLVVFAPGTDLTRSDADTGQGAAASPDPLPDAAPDGRVEDPDRVVQPVPPGWGEVGPLLEGAVTAAAEGGHALATCVVAIDAPDEPVVCAGDDQPRYAASVIKLAYAVAALEAWNADLDAETPYGRLGDLLEAAITVSDNEAANTLYDLSVEGPAAPDTTNPLEAINAVTDRVGLAAEFHTGGAFRYEWTGDMSTVTAGGSARYLAELVRAADGRAPREQALTSPEVARLVLGAMTRQQRLWKLPAELLEGSTANKTGETDSESHDIAVINTASGRYAVAVVGTALSEVDTPDDVIAGLGRDVVGALGGAARF